MGYAVGLLLANIMVVVMHMGQPALLYLVPCTLGLVTILAFQRGDLSELWNGMADADANSGDGSSEMRELGSGAGPGSTPTPETPGSSADGALQDEGV